MPEVRQKKKANRRPISKPVDKEKELAEKLEVKAKEQATAKAQEYKALGNTAFQAQDYLAALQYFTQAIGEDMTDHVFYSNRSAVNLALLRTADAALDAQGCVDIKPSWAKGYSRLGAALWADKQLKRSVEAYDKGLKLEPENEAMQTGRKSAQEELEKEEAEAAVEAAAKAAEEAASAEPRGPVEPVIGIDLGTTYSAVAVWDEEAAGVRMLADESGNRTTPSVVGWSPDGERLVGERAKAQAGRCPEKTLFDIKRILGRRTHDEAVKAEMKLLPFSIVAGPAEQPLIEVPFHDGAKRFAPEEISAMVLRRMKEIAEKELGRECTKAVVTVPAYFNDAQRQATQAAGAIAGLEVLRIINEPTAAALGYGLDQKAGKKGSNVLIFDLGGGTFDVSVLRIEGGVLEVRATGGDTRCGGEDLDNTLVDWIVAELKKKGHKDPSSLRPKLKRTAETAKRDLSSKDRVELDLEELGTGVEGTLVLTRELFESLNKAFFARVFETVEHVVKDAKLTSKEIDDIVLVGGSTRVPLIQQRLLQWGGKGLCKSINPDEAVAYGAAVQGAILSGVRTSSCQEMVLIDVTPLSLGLETEGRHHSIIIPRNSPIPCTKRQTYTTVDNYQEMIDCRVFEGERPCTDQNHLLGEFQITGIERAKKGEAQVEVAFALDANGVLHVTAQDLKTKAKAECTINNACKSLSKEQIAEMLQEAGKMEESDAEFRKKVSLRDELESLAYGLPDDRRDPLLEWLDTVDLSAISLTALESKVNAASR